MRSGYETLNALKMSPVECRVVLLQLPCHATGIISETANDETNNTKNNSNNNNTNNNNTIITKDGKMGKKGWRVQAKVLRLFPMTTDTFKATSMISLAINSSRIPDDPFSLEVDVQKTWSSRPISRVINISITVCVHFYQNGCEHRMVDSMTTDRHRLLQRCQDT